MRVEWNSGLYNSFKFFLIQVMECLHRYIAARCVCILKDGNTFVPSWFKFKEGDKTATLWVMGMSMGKKTGMGVTKP